VSGATIERDQESASPFAHDAQVPSGMPLTGLACNYVSLAFRPHRQYVFYNTLFGNQMIWMFCLMIVMTPTFFKLGAATVMVGVLQAMLVVALVVASAALGTSLWLWLRRHKAI
jgi:hypothetical protein